MRRLFVLAATVALIGGLASPGVAGGWWSSIQLDLDPVGVGEEVVATAHVMFPTAAEAEEARRNGSYHAYLVRGIDQDGLDAAMSQPEPGDWWAQPSWRWHLGEVTLGGWDANLATAQATFVVPDVRGGRYALMFCDRGCRTPLADVIPRLDVEVFADARVAALARVSRLSDDRLAGDLDRLSDRLDAVRAYLLDVIDVRAREASERAAGLDTTVARDLAAVNDAIARLDGDVATLADDRDTGWAAAAGWFVAGAATAAALALAIRRRPDHSPPDDPDVLREDTEHPPSVLVG